MTTSRMALVHRRLLQTLLLTPGLVLERYGFSLPQGAWIGSVVPGPGNAIGAAGGLVVGGVVYVVTDVITINDKSLVDWGKEGLAWVGDTVVDMGCWIGDTASDVGSWIANKWSAIR